MITDNDRNYNQDEDNFTQDNLSYVDQYQQQNNEEENLLNDNEDPSLTNEENLDTEFSNALDLDDFENDFDDDELEEEDSEEEKEENYNGEQIEEPETFADDGYKID